MKQYESVIKTIKDADIYCRRLMKIIDEIQRQKNKDRQEEKGDVSYSESVRAEWFCRAFKLGCLQLMCKASLIFKSKLELALSIILKERELYESKHVVVE